MYAGEVKTMRYAKATYGNLAYDLRRATQPDYEYEEEPVRIPERAAEKKVRVAARPEKRVESKIRIAPTAVVGFMAAALMLVMVLMGYIQLTKVSAEASSLQKQIVDLKNTEAKLKIQYESTFDLNKIESYAVSRLGMVPATNSQVYYINGNTPDKAEVISGGRNGGGIIKNVTTFLSHVVEYFK